MIRPATPQDAERIARAHVQCWEETYRGVLPDSALDPMTYEKRLAQWAKGLGRDDRAAFVHETGGAVTAFASVHFTDEEPGYRALLSTLYVLKTGQGQGLGRALLQTAARHLVANGVDAMWLLTLRDRNPARVFYERQGARLLREQPAPAILGEGVMDVVYAFDDLNVAPR